MKAFVLIAALWNPEHAITDAYVLDHGMTGADCIAALAALDDAVTVQLEPGFYVAPSALAIACEIDRGANQ